MSLDLEEGMSESDNSVDYDFLFQTKTAPKEELNVLLDSKLTLAGRKENKEIEIQTQNIQEQTVSSSQETESSLPVELVKQSLTGPVQEFKSIHPGRSSYNENESCCIFSEESLNIKDFRPSQDKISHVIFELSNSELLQLIYRNQLRREYQQREVIHHLCSYLFFLLSVHRDKRIVECSASTVLCIKEDWFPSVDTIFIVFVNWGIRSEYLDLESIEVDEHIPFQISKKFVGNSRKLNFNIEKTLEIIGSSAKGITKTASDDKLDKLIYVLVISALEHEDLLTSYSQCICNLLSEVSQERWNYNRVQKIAELLFCEGTEDYYNLLAVCNSLLILGPQAQEVARFLACITLNKLVSDEKNMEPLDWISCQKVSEQCSYYNNLHELKLHELWIALKLVNFCIFSDYQQEKLIVDELQGMIMWLSVLGGKIMTQLESIDGNKLKELISRYLSLWRMMLNDAEDLKIQSLCNASSSECGSFDMKENEM